MQRAFPVVTGYANKRLTRAVAGRQVVVAGRRVLDHRDVRLQHQAGFMMRVTGR
jgi:hypothetical protein